MQSKTPIQAVKQGQESYPEPFNKRRYNVSGHDTLGTTTYTPRSHTQSEKMPKPTSSASTQTELELGRIKTAEFVPMAPISSIKISKVNQSQNCSARS
jgi:hypothetical protein